MNMEIGQGFGSVLAEAREAKGLTVADVAEKLKLTPRQIEALEAEDLSRLPSAVFVRGFVRNYARLLDLPPDDLPGLSGRAVEPTSTLVAPSEDVVFRSSPGRRRQILPWIGLILLIVAIGVLYVWLRQGEDGYSTADIGSEQTLVPTQPQPSSARTAPPAAAETHNSGTSPKPAILPSAGPTPPAVNESGAATAAAGSGHVVHVVADGGDTWVKVSFAGQKRVSHLLRIGEQFTVRGAAPVQIVVGDATHTLLTYDGKPVALTPPAGGLVARLTLK